MSQPPSNVRTAAALYAVPIVTTFVPFVMLVGDDVPDEGPALGALWMVGILSVLKVALLSTLVYLAYRRRNWARVLLALWSGISVFSLMITGDQSAVGPVGIIDLVLVAVVVLAAILMFTPSANAWFQTPDEARSGSA